MEVKEGGTVGLRAVASARKSVLLVLIGCMVSLVLLFGVSCSVDATDDGDATGAADVVEARHVEDVPPCTPWPGSERDPCERRVPWKWADLLGRRVVPGYVEPEPVPTIRERMDKSFESSTQLPHLVVRGVVIPGSTRCAMQTGSALTKGDFAGVLWYAGGREIRCFVDVSVREYLVGGGPALVTIVSGWRGYDDGHNGDAEVPRDAAYFAWVASPTVDALEGYEWIFWLEVPLDPTSETWESSQYWSVQRRDDGAVVAVDRWSGRHSRQWTYADRLEIPLDRYVSEVKTERRWYDLLYGGRVCAAATCPDIIATADRSALAEYLRLIGTYDVPGFTPQPPPPAPEPGY